MSPAKLHKHCDTNHPEYREKILVLSGISLRHYQSLMMKSSKTDNENATEASYGVINHTALAGEAYTVAKTIINHVRCQWQLVYLVSHQK